MKNIDKIKQMSSKEIAKLIGNSCSEFCAFGSLCSCSNGFDCVEGVEEWLELESEE